MALPGVQVLFAFLLVVPFNQRFLQTTPFQRGVYFATLMLTAGASVCLIAPSMHHRLQFRRQQKEHIVVMANRLAIAGLSALALAMVGVVLLVTDVLFGEPGGAIVSGAVAVAVAAIWYAIPIRRRLGSR